MIPNIYWSEKTREKNPFLHDRNQRPLTITLHNPSLQNLSDIDKDAIEAIYELSSLDYFDLLDFEGKRARQIKIQSMNTRNWNTTAEIIDLNGDVECNFGGTLIRSLNQREQFFDGVRITSNLQCNYNDAFGCLSLHLMLNRDIFVTLSPDLIDSRVQRETYNVFTPVEAARLIGLLLRSKGNWTLRKYSDGAFLIDRSLFYIHLMKYMLPMHANYHRVDFEQLLEEELIENLNQSFWTKCTHALQAFDEIRRNYLLPQNNLTREDLLYHFNYLTLLLSGALDTQAAIVKECLNINIFESKINFRKDEFLNEISKKGYTDLWDVLTSEKNKSLFKMLNAIRNSIHTTGLSPYGLINMNRPETSLSEIPQKIGIKLMEYAQNIGGSKEWGIFREDYMLYNANTEKEKLTFKISTNPYIFANKLISEIFPFFDVFYETLTNSLLKNGYRLKPPFEIPKGLINDDKYLKRIFVLY